MSTIGDDNLVAVLAHSLIGPVAACQIAAGTVRDHPELPAELRGELLQRIVSSSRLAIDMMQDMVRGASGAVLDALRELEVEAGSRTD